MFEIISHSKHTSDQYKSHELVEVTQFVMVERNYFPINHFICSYECHRRLLKWSMSVT